jgi:nucleoside-diphosphate-sugar epimerase
VLRSAGGDRVFGFAVEGKAAQFTGRLDVPHTYTYIDDFGEAMVILAENEEALGQAWHVPSSRPAITQREFGELIYQALGVPPKITSMGKFMMQIGGLFVPAARETVEMMYEFEKPFVVDHTKFVAAFGDIATPLEESIKATVSWYQASIRNKIKS